MVQLRSPGHLVTVPLAAIFLLSSAMLLARVRDTESNRDEYDHLLFVSSPAATPAPSSMSVRVSNLQYGEVSSMARSLYGFDLVAEPFRESIFEVLTAGESDDFGSDYLWSIERRHPEEEGGGAENLCLGWGRKFACTLRVPGADLVLSLQKWHGGKVEAKFESRLACRYVRREIRALTPQDRESFLNSLGAFYGLGDSSVGVGFPQYELITAMHNANAFCYHDGLQFLTSHWAFSILVERSLQSVDPMLSLAYWDFMVEAGTLGAAWPESPLFSPDLMGSAMGSAEDMFRLDPSSRFAGLRTVYDPDGTSFVGPEFGVARDAYGRLNSPTNNQDEQFVARSHSYCGMPGSVSFASCEDFVACFDSTVKSLYEWEVCMERQIHANMHGWLGGAWNCAIDVAQWRLDHPTFSSQLLTFALNYITANRWPSNSFFGAYNECPVPASCLPGITPEQDCTCHCNLDVESLTDEAVYGLMEDVVAAMGRSYGGADFVYIEGSHQEGVSSSHSHRYRFQQGGYILSFGETADLLRMLAVLGCTPGYTGAMSTGASPSDPIFWLLHPIYDKALHALTLSPDFPHIELSWHDLSCPGSKEMDQQPFSLHDLGMDLGAEVAAEGGSYAYLTNRDIFQMAAGKGAKALPYMYDGFDQWGTCHWSACISCEVQASPPGMSLKM
jgi:hypothetical protein